MHDAVVFHWTIALLTRNEHASHTSRTLPFMHAFAMLLRSIRFRTTPHYQILFKNVANFLRIPNGDQFPKRRCVMHSVWALPVAVQHRQKLKRAASHFSALISLISEKVSLSFQLESTFPFSAKEKKKKKNESFCWTESNRICVRIELGWSLSG